MIGLTLLILLLVPEFCLGFKYESSSNLWNFRTPVIGIDFGTTYSRVGVYNNGSVDIISDDRGNRAIPSLVAFTETGGRLFGEAAENQLARNPERTIFHVKRLIGRMFDDPEVQRELKRLPYKVVNKDGKPYIEVKIRDGEMAEVYSPEEISAMIIENIKEMAEYYLGRKIHKAVVTVPAYFNEAQRQATKDAYALAGLTVVNEPTAAAIAFGLYGHAGINPKSILVVDLGGGTFDFSVLTIDEGVIEVLSNISHTNLGCEDFNRRLTDYLVERIKEKHYDRDISQDKLRKESERAKRALSRQHQVQVEIDDFFSESLTRDRFEEMSADLFGRMVGPVERALKDRSEVDEIVVVGGCTRIPRVKEMLSGYFGGKELLSNIGRVLNPDEAVAYGAAIQGWILKELPHLAWNELSLGIETAGGVMTKLIPRNTIMPIRRAQVFSTCKHNQTTVSIKVYDGERALTRDCRQLGSFQLSGIPPAPRGVPQIVVNLEVDENYILKVTAAQAKKLKSSVSITLDVHPRTTKDKIQEKIRDAEEDRKAKEKFGYNMEMECSDNEMIELPQDTLVLDDGKKKFSDRKEEVEEESKDEL